MKNRIKSARQLALRDIANEVTIITKGKDVYTVGATRLDTKESRRLNKELDLHKINK